MRFLEKLLSLKKCAQFWVLGETRRSMTHKKNDSWLIVPIGSKWWDRKCQSWWWWWAQVMRLGEHKKWLLLFTISDWSIIMNGPSGEIWNYLSLCTVQFGRVSSVFSCLLLGRSPTFDLQCDKSPSIMKFSVS